MTDVGFLGLGTMGAAIARRLLDDGHRVTVWNRSRGPVDDFVASGAIEASSPAEALAAPVSFSMLANDEACDEVLRWETADPAGRIHVNLASVSPAAADRLTATAATAGVTYLAAPVLGRANLAAAGKLNIMAAGEPAAIDAVQPLLEVVGVRVWRLGDRPRMANVVKAAVNYNIIHAIQALGESLAMVEAHGVEGRDFVELLTNSLFGGVAYTVYGQEIVDQAYRPPGFTMALGRKDLGLAESVAAEAGVTLPVAPVLRQLFETALADPELRDADWGALAEVTRRGLAAG